MRVTRSITVEQLLKEPDDFSLILGGPYDWHPWTVP